jgi:glycosyltransferase involved in cell wall biosynthesis
MPLKISVIMVVRNGKPFIEQALQSVLQQSYKNWELIVYDGLSTDGTLQILEKYRSYIHHFRSEKDSGPGEALNKGAAAATGDLLVVMNADDRFADPQLFQDVVQQFENDHKIGAVCGHVEYRDRETDSVYGLEKCFPSSQLWKMSAFTIGGFFKRSILPTPFLNPEINYSDDYDLFCNLLHKQKVGAIFNDRVHALMRTGGRSDLRLNDYSVLAEYFLIRKKYFGIGWAILATAPRLLNPILKRIGLGGFVWWMRRRFWLWLSGKS